MHPIILHELAEMRAARQRPTEEPSTDALRQRRVRDAASLTPRSIDSATVAERMRELLLRWPSMPAARAVPAAPVGAGA